MARTERSGHTTTDHDFIRTWVEERGGWPARVAGTEGGGDDAGLIRIDFPGYSGEGSLERIEWEEWFEKFDESELAFLHRDMSHGGGDLDRFNKLVKRSGEDNDNESRTSRGRSPGASKSAGSRSGSSSGGSRSSSSRSGSKSPAGSKSSGSKSSGSKSSGAKSSSRSSGGSRSSSGGSKSGGSSSGSSAKSASSRSSGAKSTSSRSSGSSSGGGAKSTSSRSGAKSSGAAKSSSGRSNGGGSGGGTSRRSVVAAVKETLLGGNGKGGGSEIRELLKHELGDLLFAEKVFLKASKTLAREAQDPTIKTRVEEHVRETEGQIERLNAAFRSIGEKPKAEKCEAALGLQEEHDSFKSEEKPSKLLLSAFDLGSGLRVEHYEIAAYRTAIAVATAMGERECANILKENLKEEMAMAAFLEKNSLGVLKSMARA